MTMETENQSVESTSELSSTDKEETMAPQGSDGLTSDGEMGLIEQKENYDPMQVNTKLEGSNLSTETIDKKVEQMMSADEGTADDAEDGEILEDGEIASDQDGEVMEEEEEEGEDKSSSNKSSPTKQRSSGHREEHKRRGHDRRDRHSKRRRTSKEDTHKDKQKKKRHKDYDYDKSGDDYDSSWSDTKREKSDRKHDSPAHDSHGEERHSSKHDKDSDKRRRGSGERHHSGRDRDRGRDRDKSSADRDKPRDRSRDKHDRGDKAEKKDRGGRENRGKGRSYGDGYESPPGLYDSPSDDEYDASKYSEKKQKFGMEEEYIEMDVEQPMQKGKRKQQQQQQQQQQQKKFDRRRQRNERGEEFEEEAPVKKKPLLQTPMEERPVCRFFKEGKCQRGSECPFNHPKRLELCKYHLQSFCRKEGCVFMHEDFPCKYFHTGSTCYQGDNCKFSHAPLTEETKTALQSHLKEREDWEEEYGERKHKKKGLLGDQPLLSEKEIQKKLEDMKSIPSIFDIQTHKPGESPNKPPPNKGQSPNIRPQGGFADKGMPQQAGPGGPNMRFNGPPNQGGPPQRPPFMGPPGPGMDGSGMNMQGPPMVSGPNMSGGPGLMGPAPMMSGPGMPGSGMQGPPLGPPMSQAAALVGAILHAARAAPMLPQYRSQGPNTGGPNAIQGDPRFMTPNMGQGPNMDGPNMMGPPPNMGGQMMSPGQEGMMGDMHQQQQQGMMGMGQSQLMMGGQGSGMQGDDTSLQQQQSGQNMGQMNISGGSNVRDPRKTGAQNDPRLNRGGDHEAGDDDMRAGQSSGNPNMGDEDFRQDVDMRQDESGSNQGDRTPQQDWDKDNSELNNGDDQDMDIPSHLPPKQREMFLRIRQHTMKMKQEKSGEVKQPEKQQNMQSSIKMDDDKWYSSDEEDDVKPPNISNILTSLSQPHASDSSSASTASTSINVMQMINAIKSSNPTSSSAPSRPNDPRKQVTQPKPVQREPAMIYSHDGECPWRLCRVLYVKQRIPDNVDLNDSKYKADPRVQKMLKLQELEIGKVIDHTKTVVPVKSELHRSSSEHKLPDLLDPRMFKEKKNDTPRPKLAPFVDPRMGLKQDSDQNVKSDLQRPLDPRLKPGLDPPKSLDPRVQRMTSNPGLPSRPLDPRLSRQDSNNLSAINTGSRPIDPRLARQNSQDSQPGSRGSTPPMDPRMLNRQPSSEPKIMKLENLPSLPLDLGLGVSTTPDPRITKLTETDTSFSVQRQTSQPGTSAEHDAANGVPKPKLDYRNDPRFKRKRISDANLSPDSSGKRFSGQRKSSTEYSSPLGIDTSQPSEESGYNSYNRPRPTQPSVQARTQTTANVSSTETVSSASTLPSVSSDVTAHEILDSLQIMPPPGLEEPQGSDKNLKDIFKTIDPTASPFC